MFRRKLDNIFKLDGRKFTMYPSHLRSFFAKKIGFKTNKESYNTMKLWKFWYHDYVLSNKLQIGTERFEKIFGFKFDEIPVTYLNFAFSSECERCYIAKFDQEGYSVEKPYPRVDQYLKNIWHVIRDEILDFDYESISNYSTYALDIRTQEVAFNYNEEFFIESLMSVALRRKQGSMNLFMKTIIKNASSTDPGTQQFIKILAIKYQEYLKINQ